jgi:hypothetical protein
LTQPLSLDEYAKGKTRRCGACLLIPPIREQIDAVLAAGTAGSIVISKWLAAECGITLSDSVIRHHQTRSHHIATDEVREAV